MRDLSDPIVILSPGLSQSFAIADLLRQHSPGALLLACPLPGKNKKESLRWPFDRYATTQEGERAVRRGSAIMTGSEAAEHVLKWHDSVKLGEIQFEGRNLWFCDKSATLHRAVELGIPVPSTWNSYEEIADRREPIFYKPAREGTGGPRRRVASPKAVPLFARSAGYLFQEVVEGPSVIGFGFLADRGKVVASSLHHEILSIPPHGGSAVAVETCECARAEELAKRLISDFQYSGWGLIEFKPCSRRSDFVLMEVNAKFWASFEFTLRTRPRFAYLLFGIHSDAEPIRRMIWPARALRNGLLRLPVIATKSLPAFRSREPLSWRDWARSLFPQ
jgi:predicted ATP-grasp superfamily ATP-dependent carboligase